MSGTAGRGGIFRTCSKCKQLVNVPLGEKGGKRYICSGCQGWWWYMTNERLSKETRETNERRRGWR